MLESNNGSEPDTAVEVDRDMEPVVLGKKSVGMTIVSLIVVLFLARRHFCCEQHTEPTWRGQSIGLNGLAQVIGPSFTPQPAANCTFYAEKSTHCNGEQWNNFQKCGACFNAGARSGVMCKGSKPGYSCPPDKKDFGGDMAFACMDWTFGSSAMIAAEASFNGRSGKSPVYFGVGTYGVSLEQDTMGGLGMCLEMQIDGVDRHIIAQSINTGHDVAGSQFDLQMGAGGVGIFNTCAGDDSSMFPGPKDVWGRQYGGLTSKDQCDNMPAHPRESAPMKAAGDSLVELCQYAWDRGVYRNPSIVSIARVGCPAELVNLTQFRRSDEPAEVAIGVQTTQRRLTASHKCRLGEPGADAEWCLTRMMDCRKPSGAIKDNVKPELVALGHRLVQPCTADGYTRIDVQCGCKDCYC